MRVSMSPGKVLASSNANDRHASSYGRVNITSLAAVG